MNTLDSLVKDYQIGSITRQDIRIALASDKNLSFRDRQIAMEVIQDLHNGIKLMKRIRASRNGYMSKKIPGDKQWRNLVLKDPRGKAEWYLKYCPDKGTLDYNLFKRLSKAFGLGGNEFYYWIRKLR